MSNVVQFTVSVTTSHRAVKMWKMELIDKYANVHLIEVTQNFGALFSFCLLRPNELVAEQRALISH